MGEDYTKLNTVSSFMEKLIPEVEHYRRDLFMVYEEILKCREDTVGIVLTRKCGCEFYSQESKPNVVHRYEYWKGEARNFTTFVGPTRIVLLGFTRRYSGRKCLKNAQIA